MSEQDLSEPGGWDSTLDDIDFDCNSEDLDDVDLCEAPSPGSTGSSAGNTPSAQQQNAGKVPALSSTAADPAASASAESAAASGTSSGTSSATASAAASRSSSLGANKSSTRPPASRLPSNQGGPLFSLALADLGSSAGSPSTACAGNNSTPPLKQIPRLHSQDSPSPGEGSPAPPGKAHVQQQHQKHAQQIPSLQLQQPQQQQAPGKPAAATKIPSMSLRLPADRSGIPSNGTTSAQTWGSTSTNSTSSSQIPGGNSSDSAANAAAAAASAALRLPSPQTSAGKASAAPPGGSSSSSAQHDTAHPSAPGGRRTSHRSHHTQGSGLGAGGAQQHLGGRANKPPPLALRDTSASSPAGSPHAFAAAAAARSGLGAGTAATAGAPSAWANVSAGQAFNSSSMEGRQLVNVQLLLPALELYLPVQADPAAAAAGGAAAGSSGGQQQQQQQPQSPGAKRTNSGGRLRRSNSGGSSSGAAAGSGRSRGRSSFEGSLMAAAAAGEGDSLLQGQQGALNPATAAEPVQQAVCQALGVDPSQLAYYAVQQAQLPELLQQQQGGALPQQQQQQQQKLARSSSSGSGRPRSRGPSPLRGSSGGSGGKGQQPSLLQQQHQQQQGLTVVVGFRDGSCGFSLGKLEEVLQSATAEAAEAEKLRQCNQQLKDDLVRAEMRAREAAMDLQRLQREHDRACAELNKHKSALTDARSELAAAGDSFVKLEALHRSGNVHGGSRSRSSSPRKGHHRTHSRGPPSPHRSSSHNQQPQQQQQQQNVLAKAAAAAAEAVAEQNQQQQQPPAAVMTALMQATGQGRGGGSTALEYGDLIALMARVSSPGFLNFIQQFLTMYEQSQQSAGTPADLHTLMAGISPANPAAAAAAGTPRGSCSSSVGRGRTPRQHHSRQHGGSSGSHAGGGTPPGALTHPGYHPGHHSGSSSSAAAAMAAEVYSASAAAAAAAASGGSRGHRSRRKGSGVPTLTDGVKGLLIAGAGGEAAERATPRRKS